MHNLSFLGLQIWKEPCWKAQKELHALLQLIQKYEVPYVPCLHMLFSHCKILIQPDKSLRKKTLKYTNQTHCLLSLKYKPHAFYIFTDSGLHQQYSELRVPPVLEFQMLCWSYTCVDPSQEFCFPRGSDGLSRLVHTPLWAKASRRQITSKLGLLPGSGNKSPSTVLCGGRNQTGPLGLISTMSFPVGPTHPLNSVSCPQEVPYQRVSSPNSQREGEKLGYFSVLGQEVRWPESVASLYLMF